MVPADVLRTEGRDSVNLASIKIGQMIADRYRVERVLAEGGMGVVVVARHLELDSLVAIKFLHPQMAAQEDAITRFTREARAVAQLKTEHVVRMLDIRTLDADTPFMVMEYLEGFDLEQTVEQQGPLPVPKAVEYLLQACSGIGEAHAIGIVHRDLKPANVMVTKSGVKLLDFGLAKAAAPLFPSSMSVVDTAAAPQLPAHGTIAGTLQYMAPEQLEGRPVDARSDSSA
jgi:serine/threonine-protein kinase